MTQLAFAKALIRLLKLSLEVFDETRAIAIERSILEENDAPINNER